jgi:hypothetical protein
MARTKPEQAGYCLGIPFSACHQFRKSAISACTSLSNINPGNRRTSKASRISGIGPESIASQLYRGAIPSLCFDSAHRPAIAS